MNDAIPDATRKEILRLDMHDVQLKEIVRRTGVKRSTVSAIIIRTRGWLKEQWRGDIILLCDPAGIFKSGARFNCHDLNAMVRLSGLVDGVAFKITRRDGSIYRALMQGGKLIRMQGIPV